MKQTAMQTLISDIEIMCPNAYEKINKLFELKKYYLELEKQQIINAANSENSVDINYGEQYYNEKFNTK